MSRPIARPVGPTRRAEMSTSAPAPEPRSSTVSPSDRSATAVGTPQPRDALTAPAGTSSRSASSYRRPPNTSVSSAGPQLAAPPPQQPSSPPAVAAAAYRSRTVSRMLLGSAIRISFRTDCGGQRVERGPVVGSRHGDMQRSRMVVEAEVEEGTARTFDVDRLPKQGYVNGVGKAHVEGVVAALHGRDARAQAAVAVGLLAAARRVQAAGGRIQLSHPRSSVTASGTT